ncbi:MAG: tetratricopeptide repeat protein [Acidobacteria bacterium]|nr:tetratricopeptide repeat protein [Acidobacteriota bacterium]
MKRDAFLKIAVAGLILLCHISARAQDASSWKRNISLGNGARAMNHLAEAEKWYLAALKDARKFGSESSQMISTMERLAAVYAAQGKYADAEPLYQEVVKLTAKLMGKYENPVVLGRNDRTLLKIETGSGPEFYDSEVGAYKEARRLFIESTQDLIDCYKAERKFPEAEQSALRLIETLKKSAFRPEKRLNNASAINESLADAYDELATLYLVQDKAVAAESAYNQSLALRGDPDSVDLKAALTLENLAVLYARQGRYEKAEPLFRQSLSIFEKYLGPDNARLKSLLENLALLLRKTARLVEAEKMSERAQKIGGRKQN